jgi:glycosyltransferase involved in cell wall biosynthesis
MRVAMIGCRGTPARTGGVERVVEDLAGELDRRGHDVRVYGRGHYLRDLPAPKAGRCIRTPGLAWRSLDALSHSATASLDVLLRGADVVHVHSPGPALFSVLPALAGLPIVLTVHARDWRRARWGPFARATLQAGLAVGMRSAGVVTAVSRELADELARRFSREVLWIPNAVADPGPADPEALRRFGLEGRRYVLHVGRIVPEKKLNLLIEAWRSAGAPGPLVVAGDPAEPAFARRCWQLAEGLDVRFLGGVFGGELESLYAGATLVAQPSVLEGASLVVLEAARRGRAVVVAEIPANRALLGESGLYVPPGEIAVLGETLFRWYNEPRRCDEAGLRAQRHVLGFLSSCEVADRYVFAYRAASCRS